MSGPPTVMVALLERVGERGTPPMVAPSGMAAPMSTPLGPVPTAGPGPGRRISSALGLSTPTVLRRLGSIELTLNPGNVGVLGGTMELLTVICVLVPSLLR